MTLNMKVESMHKFHTFEIPTVIKHGIGAIQHAGKEVRALGVTKALLVTDPGIYNAGWQTRSLNPCRKRALKSSCLTKWSRIRLYDL